MTRDALLALRALCGCPGCAAEATGPSRRDGQCVLGQLVLARSLDRVSDAVRDASTFASRVIAQLLERETRAERDREPEPGRRYVTTLTKGGRDFEVEYLGPKYLVRIVDTGEITIADEIRDPRVRVVTLEPQHPRHAVYPGGKKTYCGLPLETPGPAHVLALNPDIGCEACRVFAGNALVSDAEVRESSR